MISEHLEVLRRIAERGLRYTQTDSATSQEDTFVYLDLFQHLLEEIAHTKKTYEETT